VEEAVATCGTALTEGHIKALNRFAPRIILAYDADAAGQAAAERFYEWESKYEVDIRVAALPPGSDPADLARADPGGAARAIADARPFLGFRLDRLLGRFDLANPEGRVRAAEEALDLIAGHPNELVRDQYLMQISDRCRVEVDALRRMSAGGRPRHRDRERPVAVERARVAPVAVSGPELEALRLAVHSPEKVANRLDRVLFMHPLAAAAFDALSSASTLHEAIDAADPQAADLIQRLAVEETDADPDDVLIRLVERATHRAIRELTAEMRQAPVGDQASYPPTVAWLKLALDGMKTDDVSRRPAALEAEERLVAWIVARELAPGSNGRGHTEAPE